MGTSMARSFSKSEELNLLLLLTMANKNKQTPPKLVFQFFRWYCNPDYLEDIEGDLLERIETWTEGRGRK